MLEALVVGFTVMLVKGLSVDNYLMCQVCKINYTMICNTARCKESGCHNGIKTSKPEKD
jgi:hypothetical protein